MQNAMSPNVKIIHDLYEASARGDFGAAMANWSPQIIWNVAEGHPYANGNPYIGIEAIGSELLAKMASHMPDVVTEVSEMLDADDKVVVLGRYKGPVKSTNKTIDAQMVHIWTIEDGKIVKFQQHVDTQQLNQVLKAD